MNSIPKPNPVDKLRSRVLLDAALDLHQRHGWSMIATRGKQAAGRWKCFQDRPADERTLRRCFGRADITGLAVILGTASAMLAVRDFDVEEAYRSWAERNPSLARSLPTSQTHRGKQIFFTAPVEAYHDLGDGEYRADCGHYTVLPPSLHPSGTTYRWLRPPGKRLPEVDPWEDELLVPFCPAPSGQEGAEEKTTQAQTQAPMACVAPLSEVSSMKIPEAVAQLFRRTLPGRPGQRNNRLWPLARGLMGLFGRDMDEQHLRQLVDRWYQQALPRTSGEHSADSNWQEFLGAWQKVQVPLWAIFTEAVRRAEADPDRLVALCRELQRQWGDRPFFLGCREAGMVLGVHFSTASCRLRRLERAGILRRVRTGSKKSKHANEYHFIEPEPREENP
jgi:hypothetical protein